MKDECYKAKVLSPVGSTSGPASSDVTHRASVLYINLQSSLLARGGDVENEMEVQFAFTHTVPVEGFSFHSNELYNNIDLFIKPL